MENNAFPVRNTQEDKNQKAGDLEDVKSRVSGCFSCQNQTICLLVDMPVC